MATDLAGIVTALTSFYDFAGRTIVSVGAGGGQLVEYARRAERVFAVDPDGPALERLRARLEQAGLGPRFTLVWDDILAVHPRGDVVVFEFCLHLLPDPERALVHAAQLAPDVVVIDHARGSRWMWCAAEDAGVAAAWAAVERRSVKRTLDVAGLQRFADFEELEAKLLAQPPASRDRIAGHRGQRDIVVDMPYRIAL